MREIKIHKNQAGQRMDKFLMKYMSAAPKSFVYKMLRKKNIKLNGKKAVGNEILAEQDLICLYLSEETIGSFIQVQPVNTRPIPKSFPDLEVLYEDEHLLFLNKPPGVLSQKAQPNDSSAVEWLLQYLERQQPGIHAQWVGFKPSVCNRLDRNTSGILAAGKTLPGLQKMAEMFKERTVHKYYLCVVKGVVKQGEHIRGYLKKDTKTNQVRILAAPEPDAKWIETKYRPLKSSDGFSLLEVELLTGRSHQIRAHLASAGHPILGDGKYGERKINERFRQQVGLNHQLLHSYKLAFPKLEGPFAYLSECDFTAAPPDVFLRVQRELNLDVKGVW